MSDLSSSFYRYILCLFGSDLVISWACIISGTSKYNERVWSCIKLNQQTNVHGYVVRAFSCSLLTIPSCQNSYLQWNCAGTIWVQSHEFRPVVCFPPILWWGMKLQILRTSFHSTSFFCWLVVSALLFCDLPVLGLYVCRSSPTSATTMRVKHGHYFWIITWSGPGSAC